MQVAHQGDRVRSADQHAVSQPNREALTQRLLTLSHSMDMLLLQRHVEGMLCTGGVARERPAERVEKRLDRRRLPAECHGGACCLPGCGHWVEHVAALPTQQPISRQAAGVQPVVNVATVGPRFAAGVGLQGGTEAGPEGTVSAGLVCGCDRVKGGVLPHLETSPPVSKPHSRRNESVVMLGSAPPRERPRRAASQLLQ
jgi:hypothetical protein